MVPNYGKKCTEKLFFSGQEFDSWPFSSYASWTLVNSFINNICFCLPRGLVRGRWLNTLNPILESTFLKGKRKINWRSESCGLSKVEVLLIDESVEARKSAVKPNKKTLKKLPAHLRLRTFPTFEGKYATRFSMPNSLSRYLHTYFYNRVTAFCATGAREGGTDRTAEIWICFCAWQPCQPTEKINISLLTIPLIKNIHLWTGPL